MKPMVAFALNEDERDTVAKILLERLAKPRKTDDTELLNDVAAMMLKGLPLRQDVIGALGDG